MPGSTSLRDLPGGPPDNQGYDDSALLNNIIDQVQAEDSIQSGGHIAGAGNHFPGGGKDELQDYEMPNDPIDRLGNQYNPNIYVPSQQQAHSFRQPPGQQQGRFSGAQQGMNHVSASRPMQLQEHGKTMIDSFTEQLKEPILIAALVFLTNMEFTVDTLDRLLPNALKIFDGFKRETFTGSIIRALFVGLIFYIVKKFVLGVDSGFSIPMSIPSTGNMGMLPQTGYGQRNNQFVVM